jgi:hypothetical protein
LVGVVRLGVAMRGRRLAGFGSRKRLGGRDDHDIRFDEDSSSNGWRILREVLEFIVFIVCVKLFVKPPSIHVSQLPASY